MAALGACLPWLLRGPRCSTEQAPGRWPGCNISFRCCSERHSGKQLSAMRPFPFWRRACLQRAEPGPWGPCLAWGAAVGPGAMLGPAAGLAGSEGAAFWKPFLPPLKAQRDFCRQTKGNVTAVFWCGVYGRAVEKDLSMQELWLFKVFR